MDPSSPAPHEDDRSLTRRFAAGEAGACRLVERWARTVVYFRGFGFSPEERDDAVQDTLAVLWQLVARPDFQLTHGLRALIRTVASARCIDRLRRRRSQVEPDDSLLDPAPGPLERAVASDERTRLLLAVQSLGAACRELIRLHFLEGLAYAEIARREDRNESTLRVRMFQCMQSLRRRLGRADT